MRSKGLCILAVFIALLTWPTAGQQLAGAPPIDGDDIGGTVTGAAGPEAGVWVIAETMSLPTPSAKAPLLTMVLGLLYTAQHKPLSEANAKRSAFARNKTPEAPTM